VGNEKMLVLIGVFKS